MARTVYNDTSRTFSVSDSTSYGTITASVTVTCTAAGAISYSAKNSQSVSVSDSPKVGYSLSINGSSYYSGYYGSSGSYTVYCKYNAFPRAGGSSLYTTASGNAGSTSAGSFNVTVGVGSGRAVAQTSSNTFYRNSTTYYTVTFVNGLGTTLKTQEVASGGSASAPSTPTRTGYTFAGWSGTYTNVTSDRTITATWTINSYNLSINPNGGYRVSDGNTSTVVVSKNYGATEAISERAKDNYYLAGYTLTNSSSGSTTNLGGATFTFDDATKTGTFTQGTVACTLTANWVLDAYTITFENNGGSGGPTTQAINANETGVLTIQTPSRIGYSFRGWDTSSDAVTPVYLPGDSITLTEDITLYAVWDIWTYNLTFDANGGSGEVPDDVFLMGTEVATIGSKKPTAKGRTFILWNTAADGSGESYYPGDVWKTPSQFDVTLYAMYLGTDIYFNKDGSIECIEFVEDASVVYPQLQKNGRIVAAQFIEHDDGIIFEKGIVYANEFIEKERILVPGVDAVG